MQGNIESLSNTPTKRIHAIVTESRPTLTMDEHACTPALKSTTAINAAQTTHRCGDETLLVTGGSFEFCNNSIAFHDFGQYLVGQPCVVEVQASPAFHCQQDLL